jgi:hypothetical protein
MCKTLEIVRRQFGVWTNPVFLSDECNNTLTKVEPNVRDNAKRRHSRFAGLK